MNVFQFNYYSKEKLYLKWLEKMKKGGGRGRERADIIDDKGYF